MSVFIELLTKLKIEIGERLLFFCLNLILFSNLINYSNLISAILAPKIQDKQYVA